MSTMALRHQDSVGNKSITIITINAKLKYKK